MSDVEFEKRHESIGPVFTEWYDGSNTISSWTIDVENEVSLRLMDVTVSVTVTEANDQNYKGTVRAFENVLGRTFEGISIGDTVSFRYENIIGCSK
ncbi:hypothetical protein [Pseudoalteromonas piratica]|uniref:Uncharacterized protein n=1 Tax=Pseudoalteromonas piratica TaxID=1348114 RepID=A0A0A7EBJ2_9GAMM|nr:hypothetical protein [Pseudoalteromonas piratica]AIY63939.1 hypothetical protein OM33_01285 [Pseudoalteromonas piratica]